MRAKAGTAHAAEGGIALADLKLRERLDVGKIRDVERQYAGMRPPAAGGLLGRILRLVFLVNDKCDAPTAYGVRQRHHRMRRLREERMIVVAADRFGLRQVRYVDHAESAVPAARPHLIAEAQRMMQAMAPSRPGRLLAGSHVLARHPPARDFPRLWRIA